MLKVIGVESLDELAEKALPAGILDALTADGLAPGLDQLPPPATEEQALAELRAMADSNTVAVSMIGQGYFDTLTPAGVAPQHPREPRLVHRLHAVSAGDQPGQARGAAELPDDGRGTHRPRGGQRLDARRGHRRGRGHDADAPRGQGLGEQTRRRRRRLPPDRGGAGHPRRAAGHRDRHRRPARRTARRRLLRRDRPAARRQRRRRRLDRADRRRRTSAARWSPSAPTCWR